MSWSEVVGQERVIKVLRSSLDQDRISHAYLFFGPYGVGKRATAIAFAKALHCTEGARTDPCNECVNCSRIGRMIHPDVRFFLPSPNKTPDADVAERIGDLAQNPYKTLDFVRRPASKAGNRQVFYPISFIHEQIKPIIDFKSFEGSYKVMVIMGAEALGERTANAFLKMLEEPTDRTVFILVTERPDRLLPTILSRCQPVRFDRLPSEKIEATLIDRFDVDRKAAGPAARLADGSLSVAIDMIDDRQAKAFREDLLPFLRQVYKNEVVSVMDHVDELSNMSLDQIKLYLALLLVLIRDLVLVRELGAEAPVVNVDSRETLERFCAGLPLARLDQMVDLTEEAMGLFARNVKAQLVLTSLAAGLRRSMLGRDALPLTTPLADQLVSDIA